MCQQVLFSISSTALTESWDGVSTGTRFPWKQPCRGAPLELGAPPQPSFSAETPPGSHPAPNPAHLVTAQPELCPAHAHAAAVLPVGSHRVISLKKSTELSLRVQHAHQSTSSAPQLWHKRSQPGNHCDLSECPHRFCACIIGIGNGHLPDPNFRKPTQGHPMGCMGLIEWELTEVKQLRSEDDSLQPSKIAIWPRSGQRSPRGTSRNWEECTPVWTRKVQYG